MFAKLISFEKHQKIEFAMVILFFITLDCIRESIMNQIISDMYISDILTSGKYSLFEVCDLHFE